jgi:ornithine cyclodeaminase
MKIISVESLTKIINRHGFDAFMRDLIVNLKEDFGKWEEFTKMPRPAMHVPGGVIELMPICDNRKYYSFKYVNGHPKNPFTGKMTVSATGQLSTIDSGYPVMFSEMTILTAFRTAAAAALATDLMARKNAKIVAIIGTGAQSEFQIRALQLVRNITEVRYFDINEKAMDKFEKNMRDQNLKMTRCVSAKQAVFTSDIITVCTASKKRAVIVKDAWVKKGVHINGLGGDTAGKTELERKTLQRCLIAVEYFEQSFIEGEIQQFSLREAKKHVAAHLHELVKGTKKGRVAGKDITLFDSVGIALEDYSALRLTYKLAEKYKIGQDLNLVPDISDPKNLFSAIA